MSGTHEDYFGTSDEQKEFRNKLAQGIMPLTQEQFRKQYYNEPNTNPAEPSKETIHNLKVYKNKAAKYIGYKDWDELVTLLSDKTIGQAKNSQFMLAIDTAIEFAMKDRDAIKKFIGLIKDE